MKYIIYIAMNFVGCLYIMDLINTLMMECITKNSELYLKLSAYRTVNKVSLGSKHQLGTKYQRL